jgi:hypothetical protein
LRLQSGQRQGLSVDARANWELGARERDGD